MPHPGLLTQSPAPSEFPRIARRHKKAFLSEKCKGIEENNRIGKIRDLFKKIRDTKGTLHSKVGTIKDKNKQKKKHEKNFLARILNFNDRALNSWLYLFCFSPFSLAI